MNTQEWQEYMRRDGVAVMDCFSSQYYAVPLDPMDANKRKRRSWTVEQTSYLVKCVSEVVREKGLMIDNLSQPTNLQKGNKDLTVCWTQVVSQSTP